LNGIKEAIMAKDTASGKIPANGLSSKEDVSKESLASLALASHGPNQLPIGVVHKSISTDRGKFSWG
tara:strand:+ start:127 stop:327 length:201 start_codon:yes stop_codon:yes gene_type:complete